MSKILAIFGATGNQGGSLVDYVLVDPVLSKEYNIRAITRDASSPAAKVLQDRGIEVVAAEDYEAATLSEALKGAHTIFSVTITVYDESLKAREYSQGKAIADAAVSVGASYIIFSTQARPSALSGGKVILDSLEVKAEIEAYIRSLPIKSAFFAPGGFMQNYTGHSAPQPLGDGTFGIFNVVTPETKIPLIDIVGDTGKYIGAILASPDKYNGKVMSAATQIYTLTEIADTISKVTGKTVVYKQLPEQVWKGFMPTPVMGENMVAMFTWMQDFGYFGPQTEDVVKWTGEQARGRLTTFEEWLGKNQLALE